jgi:nitroreductase
MVIVTAVNGGEYKMNMIELIKGRRNIKKFKSDPLDPERIQSWLQAAAMAPNHRMTEPWEIYFIGPDTRASLNHKTNFGNAPMVMAILSRHGKTTIETIENALATACFIQNLNLAAWSEGAGTFWSSIGNTPANRVILGVPDNYDVIGTIAIGIPEEIPEAKLRIPVTNKIKSLP